LGRPPPIRQSINQEMIMNSLKTQFRILLCGAIASLGAIVLPLAAPAVPTVDSDQPPSKTVSYADLNLTSPAGAATLYHRIQGAAKQVCKQYHGPDLTMLSVFNSCYRTAVENAVRTVNSNPLTALHERKITHTGRS
jgi:UrcA family protein